MGYAVAFIVRVVDYVRFRFCFSCGGSGGAVVEELAILC
jgi:hypothetical protein